ncbi:MAG: hypothetical protein M3M89_03785 [Thermoproteota archaeon]|nr:hypothetical protein [Thermoproteota archaeon]
MANSKGTNLQSVIPSLDDLEPRLVAIPYCQKPLGDVYGNVSLCVCIDGLRPDS